MSNVLVTGANRGIGLELCRQLHERGDQVIAACRTPSTELQALGVRVETGLDVTSDEAVAALATRLSGVSLDVLINNAGILAAQGLDNLDWQGIRRQFEVNSLGPLRVSRALLGNLVPGAKIAMITSRMGSIADNTSGGSYGYRMSKAALNMASVSLARDLADRSIAVAILHPGWVRTDMTGHSGLTDTRESAAGLLERIDALTLDTSGRFWHANGSELPW
jgi:NAD(P)-dependent dehydrogenase (short-subunit alcohol dehydrogenase family)